MSIYTLIENHKRNHPNSHYFDRDTLKWFGERISEMRVLQKTVKKNGHECYVVSSYQHKAPKGLERHYSYFDCVTFEEMG